MSIYERKVKTTKKTIKKTLFWYSLFAVYEKFRYFAVIIIPQCIISFSAIVDKCLIYEYNVHMEKTPVKIIAKNKKAFFNYTVEEKIECGLVLKGTEVKSLREGRISFPDAFAEIKDNEVWVKNFHISEYIYSSVYNHDPERPKKLLLKKDEIKRLKRKVEEKGYTLVPLEFYFKNGIVKVLLGVCKGKKTFDKRADIKDRDIKRDMQREIKIRGK